MNPSCSTRAEPLRPARQYTTSRHALREHFFEGRLGRTKPKAAGVSSTRGFGSVKRGRLADRPCWEHDDASTGLGGEATRIHTFYSDRWILGVGRPHSAGVLMIPRTWISGFSAQKACFSLAPEWQPSSPYTMTGHPQAERRSPYGQFPSA